MHLTNSDGLTALGNLANLSLISAQFGSMAPQLISAPGVPSLFELLLSEQIGLLDSSSLAVSENQNTGATDAGSSHHSSFNSIHDQNSPSATSTYSTAINPLLSPVLNPLLSKFLASSASAPGAQISSSNLSQPVVTSTEISESALANESLQSARDSDGNPTLRTDFQTEIASAAERQSNRDQLELADPVAAKNAADFLSGQRVASASQTISMPSTFEAQSQRLVDVATSSMRLVGRSMAELKAAATLTEATISNGQNSKSKASQTTELTHVAAAANQPGGKVESSKLTADLEAVESALIPSTSAVSQSDEATASPVSISEQLATVISEQLKDERRQGLKSIRIRINSQELGTIDLHLSSVDDVISVRIITESPLAQQIISDQLVDLRKSLSKLGVKLGQLQVACNSSGRNSADQDASTSDIVKRPASVTSRKTIPPQLAPTTAQSVDRLNFVA